MEHSPGTNSVNDLIGLFESWEKVQDLAEHISGFRAQLVDPAGKILSGKEFLPGFCRLVQLSKLGETRCRACYEAECGKLSGKGGVSIFKCHAGLENILFPLSIDGAPAGAVVCGRALDPASRPDDRAFQGLAAELSIEQTAMDEAVGMLAALSGKEAAAFAKMLKPFIDSMGSTIFRYFSLIEKSEDLIVAAKESEGMMSVDRLTGLFNRRYFDARLASEVARGARYGHPISLVLMEPDLFDAKTNAYGLIAKDIVLKETADILLATARSTEVAIRYDDDRFAIIMPECDHEQAFRMAERVRKAIAVKSFGSDIGLDLTLTLSIGIASMYKEATPEKLIERAESVLSQAVRDGGNKIRLSPMPGPAPEKNSGPHIFVPSTAKKRRVVVTGLGLVTPIGIGKNDFWSSIKTGTCGIGELSLFDSSILQSRVAAEVHGFEASDHMSSKDARRMDRFAQFAVAASRMAIEDAQFKNSDLTRMGVRLGTNVGGIGYAEDQHSILLEKGPHYISPFLAIAFSIGSSSSQISLAVGAKGSSLTIGGECTSGASAIISATNEILENRADVMLAGGAEAPIRPIFMTALDAIHLLSLRNDEPSKASRPFDLNRDGIVIGEGSAMVVLEDLDHALARGAHIYGEVMGYGMTCDAFHMVQPDPEGKEAARAIEMALNMSRLRPNDVGYINAHGSSTQVNDVVETRVIKNVFGDHASKLPISGTKSMTGHAIGAVAAIEFVATTLALQDGFLPPTLNYEIPDPDCDLDYIPNQGRGADIDFAVSNSFGFGGKNAILALGKYSD